MTTVFYAPPDAFDGRTVVLPEDEARHAVKVLRHDVGDDIVVVDGVGGRHSVRLAAADRKQVSGEVFSTEREVGEPTATLSIGLGVLKNANRFETFVEKAVELGVTEIIPLTTERAQHVRFKPGRLTSIMVAAMKQSGRCRLPTLLDPQPYESVIRQDGDSLRILCHEGADTSLSLTSALTSEDEVSRVAVLIGPEGGFSDAEVESATESGWRVGSLGSRRLRAETAAILAAGTVMLYYER